MNNLGPGIAKVLKDLTPTKQFNIGPIQITQIISHMWIIMAILFAFIFILTFRMKKYPTSRRQMLAEWIVNFFREFTEDSGMGKDRSRKLYGVIGSLFMFILFMNFAWVIPNFQPPTSSFSVTIALAISFYYYAQYVIIKYTSFKDYCRDYIKPMPFMLPINLMDLVTKPLSMAARLYGNIFAGGVLGSVLALLFPVGLPLFAYAIGTLSGVVQAYVFTMLILSFMGMGLSEV